MAEEKIFDFNLLPAKSRELLKKEGDRDESTFYSVVLIFSGIIIFLILTLLDLLIVQTRINQAEQTISDFDTAIADYDDVRSKNGQLFLKGERLSPVLDADINLNDFLDIADSITGGRNIENYAREDSGSFIITFYVDSHTDALAILDSASAINNVESPFIREISMSPSNIDEFEVILEFNISSNLEQTT